MEVNESTLLEITNIIWAQPNKTKKELPKSCLPIIVNNVLVSTSIITAKFYPDSINDNFDETIEEINEIVNKKGFAKKGDRVINLAAMPVKESGMVNTLKISEIK